MSYRTPVNDSLTRKRHVSTTNVSTILCRPLFVSAHRVPQEEHPTRVSQADLVTLYRVRSGSAGLAGTAARQLCVGGSGSYGSNNHIRSAAAQRAITSGDA